MQIRVPSKRVREKFQLIYELEGCQKAVNFLTEYYGVKRMRIISNGKKVSKGYEAHYYEKKAYFTKRGLKKRTILHELYHHLIDAKGMEVPIRKEEKEANNYSKEFLKKRS